MMQRDLDLSSAPDTEMPSPGGRRTQASRSKAMRRRVIDAAIECLHEDGYAATSTIAVASRARVSRGAMLHHFPTKVDLMIAVARDVVAQNNAKRRARIVANPRGLERFAAITEAAWATSLEPASMTLLEIMMAARGDADLAARLPAVVRELENLQLAGVHEVAHDIGFNQDRIIAAMSRLHQAAMHGLAITLLFDENRDKVDDAILLLTWYKQQFTRRMQEISDARDTPESLF